MFYIPKTVIHACQANGETAGQHLCDIIRGLFRPTVPAYTGILGAVCVLWERSTGILSVSKEAIRIVAITAIRCFPCLMPFSILPLHTARAVPKEMSHDVFWPETFPSLSQEAEAFEKQRLPPGSVRDAAVCSLSRACMRATWRIAWYLKWEKKSNITTRNNLDSMENGLLKRGLDYIEELYSILECWKRSLLLSVTDVELSTNTEDRARGIDNLCVEYQLLADCIIRFQRCGWITDAELTAELVWLHSSTVRQVSGANEHLLKMRDMEDAAFEARLDDGAKIWDEKKIFRWKIRVPLL